MELDFVHKPAAHCENGVIVNMLRYYGIEISEPMVFGLSYGLFFSHMTFVKMSGMAVTSFRTFPGVFISRISKMFGIKVDKRRYLNKGKALKALDSHLADGNPVGCVVGMYYLPYMPMEYRFHFNGHNICIIGKDESTGEYIVSDPNALEKVRISKQDLLKVRYAKGGTYPLYGLTYWFKKVPEKLPDLAPLIRKSIRKNCWFMTSQPKWINFVGVNGIEHLSRQILTWEKKMTPRRAALNLAQVVRMLEEIGTGGAGFRYMYGAFLQEASKITGIAELDAFAADITEIGDMWRDFAYKASRVFKRRQGEQVSYQDLSDILMAIAVRERTFFTNLNKVVQD